MTAGMVQDLPRGGRRREGSCARARVRGDLKMGRREGVNGKLDGRLDPMTGDWESEFHPDGAA